eukprot:CCRYP_015953-RA/>CCRYP_015953-RA protein AED:0.48 eAED:0.48 QI:0/0/0/1/0/0/2/0/80
MISYYKLAEDWKGDVYCGITLDWNYDNRTLDISLPRYIEKSSNGLTTRTPPHHSTVLLNPILENIARMPRIHYPQTPQIT